MINLIASCDADVYSSRVQFAFKVLGENSAPNDSTTLSPKGDAPLDTLAPILGHGERRDNPLPVSAFPGLSGAKR